MAIERFWERQGPVAFTADGGQDGLVTVSDVICFKVKQKVVISSATQPDLQLEVKRVHGPTTLTVGPIRDKTHPAKSKHNLHSKEDISAYTVLDGAQIRAAEQPKSVPTPEDIVKATYEQEPTLAWRAMLVDKIGKAISDSNPLPIDGTFSVTLATTPDTQAIQNISVPNANTEFSINLPDGTKRYFVRVRDDGAKGRIAFVAGQTNTNYWTVNRGTVFDSDSLDLPINTTIYMQLNKPDQVVEVISLYKI
jgi:hypothetical protein